MQLYKIGSQGELIPYNGQCIIHEGFVYTKPSLEMQYKNGYRPLSTLGIPDYDETTQFFRAESYYYNEDGSEILANWVVYDLPLQQLPEKTIEERILDLEQAGLERDIALMELAALLTGGED